MFPDPSLRWEPIASIVDGLNDPHLIPVDADSAQFFSCVIAGDNGETVSRRRRERFFSAIIDRPRVIFGVEEMLYSALTPDCGGMYSGDTFLKETRRSALLDALRGDPLARVFRHFLMVGGNTCFEIIAFEQPTLRAHDNWDDAVGYLREKGGRL